MNPITRIRGKVAPLMLADIDTDIIIPAQFLTQTTKTGYGEYAFNRLKEDPDFVFNQPRFNNTKVLVTGDNFGCGSSREHAVWALQQMGLAAVIAPGFADIFSNNAKKNGLVLIQLADAECDELARQATDGNAEIDIDISTLTTRWGNHQVSFHLEPFFQHCLLNGQDELSYLMSHQQHINTHKQQHTHFINTGVNL